MGSDLEEGIKCPKCGHPQTCPCKTCQARNPTPKPWVWKGEDIHCSQCDYTCAWLDVEYDKRNLED